MPSLEPPMRPHVIQLPLLLLGLPGCASSCDEVERLGCVDLAVEPEAGDQTATQTTQFEQESGARLLISWELSAAEDAPAPATVDVVVRIEDPDHDCGRLLPPPEPYRYRYELGAGDVADGSVDGIDERCGTSASFAVTSDQPVQGLVCAAREGRAW